MQGFTMIEMLVVIAITTTVFGFGLAMAMNSFHSPSFRADCDMAVAALRRARLRAINNICMGALCGDGKRHGVYFDSDNRQLIIFQGDNYAARDFEVDEILTFENANTSLDSSEEAVFDRISGDIVAPVTIGILNNGQIATISVNSVGRIDYD